MIGGSGSGIGIEGCGAAAEDVAVGVDATKVTPVQRHQDELQSVLLAADIPMEEATEGNQGGEDALPEHYTSLQMRQWHRGEECRLNGS